MEEDKMDDMMELLTEKLSGLFGDDVDVQCIKGNKNELMGKMMDTYMKYPILELKSSRNNTELSVSQCRVDDIVKVLPDIIGRLLGLVPEDTRNDILYKAIHIPMTEDGGLLDELNERKKENEEEDDE